MNPETLEDKFCGCLLGLACGDAMGMPTEGLSPYEVWLKYQKIDGFYGKGSKNAGSYTGVTQLALLECVTMIASNGSINQKISSEKLLDTKKRGKYRWRSPFDRGLERSAEIQTRVAEDDAEFISRCLPFALLSSPNLPDEEGLLKACKEISSLSTIDRYAILSAFAITWVSKELIRNSSAMESLDELCLSDNSMISRLIDICRQVECIIEKKEKIQDKLSIRLQQMRTKVDQDRSLEEFVGINGNSWRHIEAVPLSLFCFLKGSDDLDSVKNAATLGGASSFVAGMTGALVGCYSGLGFIPEDTRNSIEGQGSIMELSRRLSSLACTKLEKQEFSL